MQAARLPRKFLRPALPPTILHRETLIHTLYGAIMGFSPTTHEMLPDYKLILLYAPAGYGKTTLLTEMALRLPIPCCWYSLDQADTDKLTFLRCLLESLCDRFPPIAPQLRTLITSITISHMDNLVNAVYIDGVVDTLIDLVNTHITERFVLLLCNYQEVNESTGVNEIVNRLLWRGFAQCVIVIESRVIPNLDFVHWLARGEVFSLGSQDLRFTARDICDLAALQNNASLNYAEAEQMALSFDGWIAGILLGTHLGGTRFLQLHQHDRRYLFTYVVNEVFRRENDIYVFLKQAAILQQMTPTVCMELLDMPEAPQRLAYVGQRGLFVTLHTSDSQIVYTCNSVLRELLCKELQQENPQRYLELHRRAAHIFLHAHDYEQTIYHALEAGLSEMAVKLIFEQYEEMFAQGYIETLKRWIEALPASVTALDPRLLLIQASIRLLAGEYTQAFALLDRAARDDLDTSVEQHALLLCALDLARSNAFFQAGSYQQARDLCLHTLECLPDDQVSMRTDAYIRLGICLNLLGDLTNGVTYLHTALQIRGRHAVNRQVANAHGALASAYSLLGKILLAEHHLSRAIICWEELHDEWGRITSVIRRGIMKQRQGAFAEAEQDLTHALKLARAPLRYQQGEAYALANLADLALVQEQYERTLAFAEDSLALARRLKDNRLMAYCLHTLAMAYLLKGDASTALLFVSEMETLCAQKSAQSYERTLYAMTYGTILLEQQDYPQACLFLAEGEDVLQAMNLKQEQLQVQIRLAACLLALCQMPRFTACLDQVTTLLSAYKEYVYLARLEIQRQPALLQALKRLPRTHALKTLLGLASEIHTPLPETLPLELTPTPPQALLRIRAFGDPLITLEDQPIAHWRMARAMELFFFFLHMGRTVRKEQIITYLWPQVDAQTDHTFHTTIYYLRRIIGRACISSHAGSYTLDLTRCYGERVWYDVQEFQRYHASGKQALEMGDEAQAREALLTMVGLYRGDYLQSFYNNWSLPRRDELRSAYLDARRALGQITWRNHAWDESLFHWQQMLAVDGCLEEAHSGIIRCYIRQGKHSLAFRQYQLCEEILQQELHIKPGHALQALYQLLVEEHS